MTCSPVRTAAPMVAPRRQSRLVAVVAALALVVAPLVAIVAAPQVQATPTSSIPARNAALWLAGQVADDGSVTSVFTAPAVDVSATLDVAMSLAATGVDAAAFDRAMGWIKANIATVLSPAGGAAADPGRAGNLLMLAVAAGEDPTGFAGVDLPEALLATLGASEPGLFGDGDPTFDGVFRQSLAILGLVAAGADVPAPAITWLADQQCGDDAPAGAVGGWMAYRAADAPCGAPDPTAFAGADHDSTALAIMALAAVGAPDATSDAAAMGGPAITTGSDALGAALAFFAAGQDASGGFAWFAGGDPVPNTTSLVIAALIAGGEDPVAAPWTTGGVGPLAWLEAQQIPCDQPDGGALTSVFTAPDADQFSTRQGVLGLTLGTWPLTPTEFEQDTAPCGELPPVDDDASDTTDETDVADGEDSSQAEEAPTPSSLVDAAPVTTVAAPTAAAPLAAPVTPRFTG